MAKLSTKALRGPDAVIARLARCVQYAVDEADTELKKVRAVGVGAPGKVDHESGAVLVAPNLGWKDVPLRRELEKALGRPVSVANDCGAAMLGVYVAELDAKPGDAAGIFIGTGIGGGIVLNGEPYSGTHRLASEIGHMVLDVNGPKCGCGNKGCFEALASRTAIFRKIQNAVKRGEKTVLTEMLGDALEDMRSGDLRKAIRRGDQLVAHVVEEAAEFTGVAVANLINLFRPEIVVLGGGVIQALADEMMGTIVEVAWEHVLGGKAADIEIVASKLGDQAGITGAALLTKQQFK
jgi:glucokinase